MVDFEKGKDFVVLLRPCDLLEQSIWKESYVGHVDTSQHIPGDQIPHHLHLMDALIMLILVKGSHLSSLPLKWRSPFCLPLATSCQVYMEGM